MEELMREVYGEKTPTDCVANFQEIQQVFHDAVIQFVLIQQKRAKRFVTLNKALDKLDWQALYDKMCTIRSRTKMIQALVDATAEVRGLILKGDVYWIHHPNYNNEILESVDDWNDESRARILGSISHIMLLNPNEREERE